MRLQISKNHIITKQSRELACFHEAGHAFVTLLCDQTPGGIVVDLEYPFEAECVSSVGPEAELIALGGVACEVRLAREGRLDVSVEHVLDTRRLWNARTESPAGDLLIWAHTRTDRLNSAAPPAQGYTKLFMSEAERMSHWIDLEAVTLMVEALSSKPWVNGTQIEEVAKSFADLLRGGFEKAWRIN